MSKTLIEFDKEIVTVMTEWAFAVNAANAAGLEKFTAIAKEIDASDLEQKFKIALVKRAELVFDSLVEE